MSLGPVSGPLLTGPNQAVLARSQDLKKQAGSNRLITDRFPECTYRDASWKISSSHRQDGERSDLLSMSECRQPGVGCIKRKNKQVMKL